MQILQFHTISCIAELMTSLGTMGQALSDKAPAVPAQGTPCGYQPVGNIQPLHHPDTKILTAVNINVKGFFPPLLIL